LYGLLSWRLIFVALYDVQDAAKRMVNVWQKW